MKAVIMAGGRGTRLRSITGDGPKPLVPLVGKPLMEHILELLREQGFTQVQAALGYRAEDIMARFGDGSALGIELSYSLEDRPLGTAGAVKNCRSFWQGEDFLVISGDAACDFRLKELMERHLSSGAEASLALCRHPEPLSYGLAVTGEEGRIESFIEKPDWSRVVTDLVNTGIYCLSPRAMELVPEGESFDFGKDLFPLMLSLGQRLQGVEMEGYWCDVGTPLSYYRCCADALEGKLRLRPGEGFIPAKAPAAQDKAQEGGQVLDCPCLSRAHTMGQLSRLMLELGADLSDGLRLRARSFDMHIAPLPERSALRVRVRSGDRDLARRIAQRAADLIGALDQGS